MADAIRVSGPIGGTDKTLTFETGKLALQSQGAVVASIGNSIVLATANAAKDVRPGIDFFPLTVDVEERAYAAGKIPGAFFRREGRPSEAAILTCRLTDRPLRPAFPDGFRNEVQIVLTILGADQVNPHDVLSINAASAALMISGIPFDGPIGAVRIGYSQDGKWIAHPTYAEGEEGTFELVVAGRELDNGDVAIMMVEAGGTEKSFDYYANGAPKVDEVVLAGGLDASKQYIKESIALQRQLLASVIATRGPITPLKYTPVLDYGDDVWTAVEAVATPLLADAVKIALKADRNAATDAAGNAAVEKLAGSADAPFVGRDKEIKEAVRSLTKKLVRKRIVEDGIRIDGRGPRDLRAVSAEVGVLRTAHGSGLFQRGETQVMNVTTLAMPRMNQMLDTLSPITEKRYIHHYNMPPYSTGENKPMRGPGRREIGHGALAERALIPVLPSIEEFPYAIRVVSECVTSNGSTSMASTCGSSLSLLDAGVPLKASVAGAAMGLMSEPDGEFIVLTDILGKEDAFGDMDFKVTGTRTGITALQMDIKVQGINGAIIRTGLKDALAARLEILDKMDAIISTARPELSDFAPRITTIKINPEKIRDIIGKGGAVIRKLQDDFQVNINVEDDGTVQIASSDPERTKRALDAINGITKEVEVGTLYMGKVTRIMGFGCFVEILPGKEGLVRIGELADYRVNTVEDEVAVGDEIMVVVTEVDRPPLPRSPTARRCR